MEKTRREIMDRVYLTYLPAKKFKTGCLSAQFITPLRRETASCGALLPLVLQRGTMRCPDIQQLSAAMDQLYGAQINPTIRKRAECQCIGFVASVMDDSFAPRGEKLLEPTAALLGELLLDPVTRNGRYLPEYVDSERANLLDSIRSVRNDKRDWADLRLLQEMCRDEPYGVSRLGDETAAAAINNQKLHVYSQGMMSASRLELFYCGSAPITRVEDALLEAFAALPGASEGLWRKLLRESRRQTGLEGLLTAVKSKRYTRSRLDRMVLCAFLGLTAEDLAAEAPYVRILGFRDRGRQALREMSSRLPLAHAGQGMESPYFALEQRCERLYGLFGQTLEAPELRERVARL